MIEKITLHNGVRILYEPIPYVRSASAGIWVGCGSRHEPPELSGVSHFIEHIVFKGTRTRSAAELASIMDGVGGQVNAFTTKECTCFYARALDRHMDRTLDVLCDMFFEPKIAPRDVKTERGVILEEISMYEDSPEELASERLFSAAFRGSPLGRNILGSAGTLRRLTAPRIRRFMAEHYSPERTVVSISGSFSDRDIDFLKERFSCMEGPGAPESAPVFYTPAVTVRVKPIEQNHLCIGFPGPGLPSPDRYAFQLLNCILGGGASSRLFQSVRESRGLCYSIYSFTAAHEDAGLLGVYTALSPETERAALLLIREELSRMLQDGPTQAELDLAREQITSGVLMGLESTNARMTHMARSELFYGSIMTPEEIIERYEAVTLDKVRALSQQVLDPARVSFSAVGRVRVPSWYRRLLPA